MSLRPRPVIDHESSFRQLSGVQQRQAGLLVGAAVADAAACALDGLAPRAIAALGAADPLVFARRAAPSPHSRTFRLQAELVRAMAAARGAFPPAAVTAAWAAHMEHAGESETTGENGIMGDNGIKGENETMGEREGLVPLALGALLPLPAQYPWASDAALRRTAEPLANAAARRDGPARDAALSALGVALRCLQSSADPTRNAAIRALPGAAEIFPQDIAALCPRAETPGPVPSGAGVVREALVIARSARGFDDGVRAAIRLGGPVSQRSLIVGALIGARLGVRCIPGEWIAATHDHARVVSRAIDIAQWSWNPAQR